MKPSLTNAAKALAVAAAAVAVGISCLQRTVWLAGYDLRNCPGCIPSIDWSDEKDRSVVTPDLVRSFADDGVAVLPSAISSIKIEDLAREVESMADTFMTTVLTKVVLRQYSKYEHKLDTRSAVVRDWAIHGPLAKWAAELMNVSEVRLYNAEKIYSAGSDCPMGCNPAWHRDTVAAPFPTYVRSITINVYLDDISPDGPNGDVLIFAKGSHKDLRNPPDVTQNLLEPRLKVGDVLAHDPHVFHSPSGRGCWARRSLQFRYVESPTTFSFGPVRFPHGPVPWTMAHAPGVAPHGLKDGMELEGLWYPRAYPSILESEHVPVGGRAWSVFGMLGVAKAAQDAAEELGIGNDNCTVDDIKGSTTGVYAYYGLDGPVTSCRDWKMVGGVPVHKDGRTIHDMERMMNAR